MALTLEFAWYFSAFKASLFWPINNLSFDLQGTSFVCLRSNLDPVLDVFGLGLPWAKTNTCVEGAVWILCALGCGIKSRQVRFEWEIQWSLSHLESAILCYLTIKIICLSNFLCLLLNLSPGDLAQRDLLKTVVVCSWSLRSASCLCLYRITLLHRQISRYHPRDLPILNLS